MRFSRRWAASFLAGACLLAVGTPWLLARFRPSLAAYLLHPAVFLIQGIPYGLAAALLLPAWGWRSDKLSAILAGLLLAVSIAMYIPVLSAPGQWGGDMIALAFLAMSGGTMAVLVVALAVFGLARRLTWMGSPRSGSDGVAP